MLASGRVSGAQQLAPADGRSPASLSICQELSRRHWLAAARDLKGEPRTTRRLRTQLITAYYLNKDFANAGKLQLAEQVAQTTVRAGQSSDRRTACNFSLPANARAATRWGFGNTMVQLVTYYPKPDYWQNMIHGAQTRPGFASRLTLDIDRFELATGLLTKTDDLMEMTVELSLQVPLPGRGEGDR